ncbi:AI-2E family transporter [Funiculus sociatus GB2-A5]|uniref:AI-2E family transporter n=1 Tax=Funiculus sociatus GB2-A5 TaxID=2933946 RepID=A0ABV0JSS3_9CYAN|nr:MULTISPECIES: AI-2E family transporter [unclassified Trichocoleus]MBD1904806.1 AI-2E family transporter [Trichocoleus sp. FACHB-832]MBD2063627.1 AI-2E family transporter [Trichocoleus sp. FACHB-6]
MRRSANLQRLLILGLSGPIIALNIWVLSQIFRYFEHLFAVLTIAAILAFLLNYAVRIFERFRLSRAQAVIVVLLLTLTFLAVVGVTLVPILVDQSVQLLKNIPDWLQESNQNLDYLDTWAKNRRLPLDLKGFSHRVSVRVENQVQALAGQAFGVALGTVSGLVDVVFVVVLAFYMLLYGDRLWFGLINLLPSQIGLPLSESLRLNFQNYFLTQLILGLFMVATLTPIFLVLKIPYALLFALLIGVAELIPFIGATLGIGLVTILVMLQDFWLAIRVLSAAIFMQQIKDNFLAPKLMGDFTGLNPIWIFIALLMGGQIAGLLGVILSVPLAGTIKDTIDTIRRLRQPPVVTTEAYREPQDT